MKRATSCLAQAAERKRSRDRLASQLGERRRERIREGRIDVAVGADDQQAAVAELAGHEPEEQERGLVRRVQVVEHQHQRPRGRHALQEGGQESNSRKRAPSDSSGGAGGRSASRSRSSGSSWATSAAPSRGATRKAVARRRRARTAAATGPRASRRARRPPPSSGRPARAPRAPGPVRSAPRRAGSCRCRARRRAGTGGRGRRRRRRGRRRARPARARGRRTRCAASPSRARRAGGRSAARCECRVLREDRLLELAQPLARLDAELLDQRPARVLVGLQRVGLAVRAVEGQHQLRPQALPVGVLGDQRLQLPDHLGVAAERQLGLDQLLERRDAQVVEPGDLALRERLVGEIRQRRAAPQRQRLLERRQRRARAGRRPAPLRPRRRAARSGARRGAPDRARARSRARASRPAGRPSAAPQRLAQPRDVHLHGLGGRRRADARPTARRSAGPC